MSAEVTPDDAAKARAEERAERELQLKIDTLELERAKFRFTRRQALFDRTSAAVVRGVGALVFANGTALVVGLSSYKSLAEILPAATLYKAVGGLWSGFVFAIGAFIAALTFSAMAPPDSRSERVKMLAAYVLFGIFTFASVASFNVSLVTAFREVKIP